MPRRGKSASTPAKDDATMPKLTRGHLERSYGAKVWGARHLRLCLQEGKWDFSLLFSSTSALLGSPGRAYVVPA